VPENHINQPIDDRRRPALAYMPGQIKIEGSPGMTMKLASLPGV
jgi:hypothetical protein